MLLILGVLLLAGLLAFGFVVWVTVKILLIGGSIFVILVAVAITGVTSDSPDQMILGLVAFGVVVGIVYLLVKKPG